MYIDFHGKKKKVIWKTCNYLKIQNDRFGYFAKFKMAEHSAQFEWIWVKLYTQEVNNNYEIEENKYVQIDFPNNIIRKWYVVKKIIRKSYVSFLQIITINLKC